MKMPPRVAPKERDLALGVQTPSGDLNHAEWLGAFELIIDT